MTESLGSWKSKILIYGGFLIVGFIGVMAGNWFMNWRHAEAKAEFANKYKYKSDIMLKQNDVFPEVFLLNSDGDVVNSHDIFRGKNTAIMFISPSCSPCAKAVEEWSTFYDKLPQDFQIIAITCGSLIQTSEYLEEYDFPYQYFCDTGYVLVKDYGINRYPNIMCLSGNIQIVELYNSPYNEFTPFSAYDLIKTYSANKIDNI
ncbi:MAG: peroxiredoxin family protein [candidate division Zixibacteria bacterium]|nr:peroxiredoxin family protein [candidate division Zixibacteria bacterium]